VGVEFLGVRGAGPDPVASIPITGSPSMPLEAISPSSSSTSVAQHRQRVRLADQAALTARQPHAVGDLAWIDGHH
jgi:hypothetical protein